MITPGTKMSVPRTSARCAIVDVSSRQIPRWGPRDCACGLPTLAYDKACPRCRFLDQSSGRSAGGIVSALRDARCLTLLEIAETTQRSPRNVLRTLQRLLLIARVERFQEDVEYETTQIRGHRAAIRWQYRLIG